MEFYPAAGAGYGDYSTSFLMPTYTPLSVEAPQSPNSDPLGLQGLIRTHYAPALQGELERLFVRPDETRAPRARLGSSSSGSESGDSGVWDEFQSNGRTEDLDEIDRMMRRLEMGDSESLEGGRATEVLSKAKLLEILKIRERERRRGPKGAAEKNGQVCVFCRNNGESEAIYTSHKLKDPEGNVTCPILFIYTCPICGAKGADAHTIKYCPKNDGEAVNIKALKTKRTSCGRRRALP